MAVACSHMYYRALLLAALCAGIALGVASSSEEPRWVRARRARASISCLWSHVPAPMRRLPSESEHPMLRSLKSGSIGGSCGTENGCATGLCTCSTAYTCDTAGGDCITFLVTACTGACKLVWWVWVGIGVGALIVLTVLYKMFCDSSSETTTVIVVQNPVRE